MKKKFWLIADTYHNDYTRVFVEAIDAYNFINNAFTFPNQTDFVIHARELTLKDLDLILEGENVEETWENAKNV